MQKSKIKFGLLAILICIVLIIIGIFIWQKKIFKFLSTHNISNSSVLTPTPTPFPFQELTIPYLRSRTYESQIGEMQKTTDAAEYVGYLTNYTSDGLQVNGYLTIPKGDRPLEGWPAIVFVHGYIPPASYKTLENYSAYVDYLAKNGFVVFKIDLRGHGESEGEARGGYYSSDYVIDTLSAYSALQTLDFVNSQKIGIWGHSMAGNVVLRSLASKPIIPAIVIWAGAGYTYEDLQKYRIQDNSYQPPASDTVRQRMRAQLFNTYGQFSPTSSFWKQVVPTNYLSDIKGAIQLNHAVDDNVVNIEYSRDLNSLLDKTSISHEFKEYSSGGHNISGNSFDQAMQNTVNFFKEHLTL